MLWGCQGESPEHGSADDPRAGYTYGKAIAIADGDSFEILTSEGVTLRVRLAEIDSPEWDQPYADEARAELAGLIQDRDVRIRNADTDRYGRIVGWVYVDELSVNEELLRRGAAWVYDRHASDWRLYPLETEARAARRGLWALPESQRIPPWEWRQRRRR
jgi:micrococcal nuclease